MNAFHELIGADPLGAGQAVIKRKVGKGQVAWIRAMDVDHLPRTPEHWTISEDWFMLPRNAAEIDDVMAWLVPAGFGIRVDTHSKLYVHLSARKDTGEWLVHLINHEHKKKKTARADLRVEVPAKPRSIVSIAIDDEEKKYAERKEHGKMDGNTLTIPIENIRAHRTVVLRF